MNKIITMTNLINELNKNNNLNNFRIKSTIENEENDGDYCVNLLENIYDKCSVTISDGSNIVNNCSKECHNLITTGVKKIKFCENTLFYEHKINKYHNENKESCLSN
jgi:hypothetical protein